MEHSIQPPPFEIAIAMEIALIWLLDDKKWWFSYFILISCCWCDLMFYARAFFAILVVLLRFRQLKSNKVKTFSIELHVHRNLLPVK